MKNKDLLQHIWLFCTRRQKGQLLIVLIITVLSAFAEVISVGAIIPVLTLIFSPNEILSFLPKYGFNILSGFSSDKVQILIILVFTFAVIVSISLRVLVIHLTNAFAFNFSARLSNQLLKGALSANYQFHIGGRSNEMLSTLNKVQAIGNEIVAKVISGFASIVVSVVILLFLSFIDTWLTLIFISFIVSGYVMISMLQRRSLDRISKKMPDANDNRIKYLTESMDGIKDIMLFDLVDYYSDRFKFHNNRFFTSLAQSVTLSSVPRFFMEGVAIFAFGFISYFQKISGATGTEVLTLLGVFALSAQKLLPQAQMMYSSWASIKASTGMAADVFLMLKSLKTVSRSKPSKLDFEKNICLENVCYSYNAKAPYIIKNVDLIIDKGDLVAVVGQSGSGKSSLINLIMALIVPTSGDIAVDDISMCWRTGSGWWRHISHVSQNTFVHGGSFLENICFDKNQENIDQQRLDKIIEICELNEVVSQKEGGLEELLG